jgi:hypothetical protein
MRRYRAARLIRPSWAHSPYLSAFEARCLLKLTLEGAVFNLILAGIGLLISTVAAITAIIVL